MSSEISSLIQALRTVIDQCDDASVTRDQVKATAESTLANLMAGRLGAKPETKPGYVNVILPGPQTSDERVWAKHVLSVNTKEKTGYAFEGSFLLTDRYVSLPVGGLVIHFRGGLAANSHKNVRVYEVRQDATILEIAHIEGRGWAKKLVRPMYDALLDQARGAL